MHGVGLTRVGPGTVRPGTAGMAAAVALVGFAFLVRAGAFWAGLVPDLSHDARNYDAMVRQLLGQGFYGYMSDKPNAYVSPGYPMFLTVLYALLGWEGRSPLDAVRWVQVLLGALTVGLVFLVARRACGERAALAAGLVAALYPSLVFLPLYVLTETLFLFLTVLFTWLLFNALDAPHWARWALAGGVLGLATLVRPVAAPILLVTWLWLAWGRRVPSLRQAVLASGAAFVLVMLPWWVRNYLALGKIILFATQTGNPLIAGAFPFGELPDGLPSAVDEQLAAALRYILQGFVEQPLVYAYWFTAGKFLRILGSPFYTPGYYDLAMVVHFLVVPLGVWGMVRGLRRGDLAQLLSLFSLVMLAVHLAFIPENRYGLTLLPWLFILAADLWWAGLGSGRTSA